MLQHSTSASIDNSNSMRKEQGQAKKGFGSGSPYVRSKQVMREYHLSERGKKEKSPKEKKAKFAERRRLGEKKGSTITESNKGRVLAKKSTLNLNDGDGPER